MTERERDWLLRVAKVEGIQLSPEVIEVNDKIWEEIIKALNQGETNE